MSWWQSLEDELISLLPFSRKYSWESINRGDEHHGLVVAISPFYVAKIFDNSEEGFFRARLQADAHLRLSGKINVPRLAAYYEIGDRSDSFPSLVIERVHGVVIADLRPPHENYDAPDYREYLRVFDLYKQEMKRALELGADIYYMKPQNARYIPGKEEVWLTDLSSCRFFTDQTRHYDLSFIKRTRELVCLPVM
ncbi:MAG TPA: hypothetical protein VJB05_03975 [archaeon]|nr:hypothetical protein [archaeon]